MNPATVIAATGALVLGAVALWQRRRLGREWTLLALLAASALALYASGLLGRLPDPEETIERIATALGPSAYFVVAGLAFLETGAFVGLIVPGEFAVILGGVIAGQGEIDVVLLFGLVWAAAVLGDSTSFLIGRKLGRGFVVRHGARLRITPERLEQVDRYLDRHGGKTIVAGRFIGLVRALAPFITGSSGLPYRRFIPYSLLGAGAWAATFTLLGFFFYRSFDTVARTAGQATFAFGLTVAAIVAVVLAYRRLRHPEERRLLEAWLHRQGERPFLRPIAAVARPLWRRLLQPAWRRVAPGLRFSVERLTPGGLGIEFTTALATALVGLYVFALYAVVLSGTERLTPADAETLSLAGAIRPALPLDLVRLFTDLGSFAVTAGLVALALVVLALRRRPLELFSLLAGFALVAAAIELAKAGVDRPRPSAPLDAVEGSAYPSGHAAYATVYAAVAVVTARALPGLASRATLVLVGLALAVAVGLSRIVLRVHYWSDVAGGWGLGAGVFGACAAIALVIAHLRGGERTAGTENGRKGGSDVIPTHDLGAR